MVCRGGHKDMRVHACVRAHTYTHIVCSVNEACALARAGFWYYNEVRVTVDHSMGHSMVHLCRHVLGVKFKLGWAVRASRSSLSG